MNPSSLAGHTIELLERVVKGSLPTDRVVEDFYRERRYLGSHDRRWITGKLYGIVRNFLLLREIAEKCSGRSRPLEIFLAYEVAFAAADAPSLETAYSSLFESYKMSGEKPDVAGFCGCVKTRYGDLSETAGSTPLYYSFPDFFPGLLPSNVRCEAPSIMCALNREAKVCVRVDLNRISREEAARQLAERGAAAEPTRFSPLGLYLRKRINLNNEPLYREGLIEVQEEASQFVGLLADPQKDETIVDACAGAGGKSLEMAALSAGKCRIYALDVEPSRLRNLESRALRSGYDCITTLRVAENSLGDAEFLRDKADKVVVDAPCSGSGTIRRNPDKKFRLTDSSVRKSAAYQKELLGRYAGLVKTGGLLIYSTCSIFSDENTGVIESFLAGDERFRLEDASRLLPGEGNSSLFENGLLVTYPHRHDVDGFFAAVMRRAN